MTEFTPLPFEGFHEVWWIYHPVDRELRLAHFRKTLDGQLIVVITGEIDQRRVGVRVWELVVEKEGWVKVVEVPIPTPEQVREIVREL